MDPMNIGTLYAHPEHCIGVVVKVSTFPTIPGLATSYTLDFYGELMIFTERALKQQLVKMDEEYDCPLCGADLKGASVEHDEAYIVGSTHYLDAVGIYDDFLQELVAARCPRCDGHWDAVTKKRAKAVGAWWAPYGKSPVQLSTLSTAHLINIRYHRRFAVPCDFDTALNYEIKGRPLRFLAHMVAPLLRRHYDRKRRASIKQRVASLTHDNSGSSQ